MNPNSAHQIWSLWTAVITVPFHSYHAAPLFRADMKRTTANFYERLFGSASEMRIRASVKGKLTTFTVDFRTEGSPAQDPLFRKRRMGEIADFFGKHLRMYGKVDVHIDVKIEAGDPGTGKPPSQLILAPPIPLFSKGE